MNGREKYILDILSTEELKEIVEYIEQHGGRLTWGGLLYQRRRST